MHRPAAPAERELIEKYHRIRATTEALAAPLSAEDQNLQSMPACSPTKWHRAHTTWFFETFLLQAAGLPPVNSEWGRLFNSYYEAVGPRHPRPQRGLLSRPSASEVTGYRRAVDTRVHELLGAMSDAELARVAPLVHLGLAHEEQHQELLLTDIQHALHQNPLLPAYRAPAPREAAPSASVSSPAFVAFAGGLVEVGMPATAREFSFDNEGPRHKVWLEPYALADRLVTVGEWKAFADDHGYAQPSLWLSEGYEWAKANAITAPLYAVREGAALMVFGLEGLREASDAEPLVNVSYYEADAIARYLGARLPTEPEWEVAASCTAAHARGTLLEDQALRPRMAAAQIRGDAGGNAPQNAAPEGGLRQLFGDAWEWTQTSYAPYPGYSPTEGALGEYNGKFMVNQMVLRGGSCFTPQGHVRATYRNFWHPDTRFQMSGLRLARSES